MNLNKKDIIFAVVCGLSVSWLAVDFFAKYIGLYVLVFFIILPILSVIGLWVTDKIGEKYLFIRQFGKFGLAGAFAAVVDIKVFQLLFFFLPYSLICKTISFLVGALVKYFSDKHWSFEQHNRKDMHKEMAKFFLVIIVGSSINVASFYFFGKISVGMPAKTWQELTIIFATLVTAIWNFVGYKYIVFKK